MDSQSIRAGEFSGQLLYLYTQSSGRGGCARVVDCCARGYCVPIVSIQDMVSYRDDGGFGEYDSLSLGTSDSVVEVVGYILRIYGHFHLDRYNPYVVMQAFTVRFRAMQSLSRSLRR